MKLRTNRVAPDPSKLYGSGAASLVAGVEQVKLGEVSGAARRKCHAGAGATEYRRSGTASSRPQPGRCYPVHVRNSPVALSLCFLAALALFLPGINWGLPTRAVDPYLFGDQGQPLNQAFK